MRRKTKILLLIIIGIIILINIPFRYTDGTKTYDTFKKHILIGQREYICDKGYSLQSLIWKYEYKCYYEFEDTHSMKKEIIFFNTFGFEFDEED